jgi:hypothetical protein
MKRLILMSVIISTTTCMAQTECSKDNALFNFEKASTPKEIFTLGTNPEFPFLRNLSTPQQVYASIKRNDKNNTRGMSEFNHLLMAIGFANGAKDLGPSNITTYYIPSGTKGNMGSGDFNAGYYKLSGDASNFKAWKISSATGCYVYVLNKCGNSFFPKTENNTACILAPVNLTGNMKEVTLNSSGQKVTTTENVYVYYHKMRHKKNAPAYPIAAIADAYPSAPLLLRTEGNVEVVPETYKLSVSTPGDVVRVCPETPLNVTTNINVEKVSAFGGYYPAKAKTQYKEVSKSVYKRCARKMRKAERKENRVAKLTGVQVSKYACK